MIICAKCGRENEDHYKFCLGCGASLADQPQPVAEPEPAADECPNCGAEVIEGQRFCGNCGYNLSEDGGPSRTPAQVEAHAAEARAASEQGKTQAAEPVPSEQAPHDEPSADIAAALILINPDGSPGDIVDLHAGANVVGRNSGPRVFQNDSFLSPEHARFDVRDQEVEIEDLDSLNGIFVRIRDLVELTHGTMIRVGQELLRFELLDQIEPIIQERSDVATHGSRLGGAWGRLARVSGKNMASTAFLLRAREHTIGRERGDILFPDDGYVSGTHARIFRDNDRVFIEDLDSSNGTFLKIRRRQTVRSGSLILMGKQPYRLQIQS